MCQYLSFHLRFQLILSVENRILVKIIIFSNKNWMSMAWFTRFQNSCAIDFNFLLKIAPANGRQNLLVAYISHFSSTIPELREYYQRPQFSKNWVDISFSDSEVSLIGLYSSKPQFLKTTTPYCHSKLRADSSRCDILYHPLSFYFLTISIAPVSCSTTYFSGLFKISAKLLVVCHHKFLNIINTADSTNQQRKRFYWAYPVSSIFPSHPCNISNSPSRHQLFYSELCIHVLSLSAGVWSLKQQPSAKKDELLKLSVHMHLRQSLRLAGSTFFINFG